MATTFADTLQAIAEKSQPFEDKQTDVPFVLTGNEFYNSIFGEQEPQISPLEQSARENIALQKEQLGTIENLTKPFMTAATGQALPALSALALGGDTGYTPSNLYQRQLESGMQGILRQQAASGPGVKSSATFERLADLVSGLAAEDVDRYQQTQGLLLRPGITATQQLGQASTALTGNIGSTFGALGQQLAQREISSGQAKAAEDVAKGQTIMSGIGGLISLMPLLI